jgi:hypothetical protein
VRSLPGHKRTIVRQGELKVGGDVRMVFLFDDVAIITKKQKKKQPYAFVAAIALDCCILQDDEKLGFIITTNAKKYVTLARQSTHTHTLSLSLSLDRDLSTISLANV